jgi:hypothetical protein
MRAGFRSGGLPSDNGPDAGLFQQPVKYFPVAGATKKPAMKAGFSG